MNETLLGLFSVITLAIFVIWLERRRPPTESKYVYAQKLDKGPISPIGIAWEKIFIFSIFFSLAYVFISGRSIDTLVVAASFCVGGWAGSYYSWIKLNRGIEKGIYEPVEEDWKIIIASIFLPILFSIFISAVYVFILDITAVAGITIETTKYFLALIGFTTGLLFFYRYFRAEIF